MRRFLTPVILLLLLLSACGKEADGPSVEQYRDYLCEKYGFSAQELELMHAQEKIAKEVRPILDGGATYDVPAVAVFRYGQEYIVVSDRDGFLSDDYQLLEISRLLGEYFGDMTGYETPFAMLRYSSTGNVRDEYLMDFLQNDFNGIFTKDDVPFLLEKSYPSWAGLYLFVKAEPDMRRQVEDITERLQEFAAENGSVYMEPGLKDVTIYLYAGWEELKINRKNPLFEAELDAGWFRNDADDADHTDQRKFPYYYVSCARVCDIYGEYDNTFLATLEYSYVNRDRYDDFVNGFYVHYNRP